MRKKAVRRPYPSAGEFVHNIAHADTAEHHGRGCLGDILRPQSGHRPAAPWWWGLADVRGQATAARLSVRAVRTVRAAVSQSSQNCQSCDGGGPPGSTSGDS